MMVQRRLIHSVVLILMLGTSLVLAQTWQVDFQGDQNHQGLFGQTNPVDMTGADLWNIFEVQAIDQTNDAGGTHFTPSPKSMTILDSTGSDDPNVVFTITGNGPELIGWSGDPAQEADPLQGDYLLLLSPGGDSFFGLTGPTGSLTWNISNLPANTTFLLTYYLGRVGGRGIEFTANGVATSATGENNTVLAVIDSDDNGEINGTAQFTGGEGNWAGMILQVAGDPVIAQQPADLARPLGGNAEFTVDALDPMGGTLNYQWVFDPNLTIPDNEVTLSDGGKINGAQSANLTVTDISLAELGHYYCQVGNALSTIETEKAALILGRMYHWPLDGNAQEAMGSGLDGTPEGDLVWGAGLIGSGLADFDGTDDFITLPSGFSDFSTGVSVSVWTRPTTAGNWARYIDLANGSASDNILFARGGTSDQIVFEIYNGGTGGAVWSPGVLVLDTWQMVTATTNPTGFVTLYYNGISIAAGTTNIPNVLLRTSNFIGKSNWPDTLYAGSMDDLRLYNYELSAREVADLYLLNPGIDELCVDPPQLDMNQDCMMNMLDFAAFAQIWLECGLYPSCLIEIP